MPPDVLLVLASSGLTLIASLMFFVSEEAPPRLRLGPPVSFCIPPRRSAGPPPLPPSDATVVDVSTPSVHGVLTLKPVGGEWVVTLETSPLGDTPAQRIDQHGAATGAVHDLRVHSKAGVARGRAKTWKQKPGQA